MTRNRLCSDALHRINHWYFNHANRAYTQEIAEEVKEHLLESIVNTDDAMAKLVAPGITFVAGCALERQHVLDSAETYFSQQHAKMRRSYDNLKQLAAKKMLDKRYEPIIRSLKVLLGFVENVKSAAQQKPRLTDQDIDEIFLDTFGDVDSYAETWKQYAKVVRGFENIESD